VKIKKFIKKALAILTIALIIFYPLHTLRFNFQQYTTNKTYPKRIYHQLQHLKSKIHSNGPQKMQDIFPEGEFFSYALYAQSWTNYLSKYSNQNDTIWTEGINEIQWSIDKMESNQVRDYFKRFTNSITSQSITPDSKNSTCIQSHKYSDIQYGIFYQGWLNYTYLGFYELNSTQNIKSRINETSNLIDYSYKCSDYKLLSAYPQQTWPVDNIVALASLSLQGKAYTQTVTKVMESIKSHLDPNTGIIDHYLGDSVKQARATSNVLNLIFLNDIDSRFAHKQYSLFKKHFYTKLFGFNFIKEYPKGSKGIGDIDSGPLVFGFSPVATGVFSGAAKANNDNFVFQKSIRNIELLGFPIRITNKRMYWLGSFYMTDLFAVWCKTR
jgi:hypothetical protein